MFLLEYELEILTHENRLLSGCVETGLVSFEGKINFWCNFKGLSCWNSAIFATGRDGKNPRWGGSPNEDGDFLKPIKQGWVWGRGEDEERGRGWYCHTRPLPDPLPSLAAGHVLRTCLTCFPNCYCNEIWENEAWLLEDLNRLTRETLGETENKLVVKRSCFITYNMRLLESEWYHVLTWLDEELVISAFSYQKVAEERKQGGLMIAVMLEQPRDGG
ncbi:hypothetical protein L3X38_037540 [Prunus dulcis]|uniref:Uncharacterized protein n=1 Tax=Prunus dulcis TaxID=3755 RepID=A0AAD4V4Q8_PRUDU|nr:hypothetical protein L3X38_037540 [Prunus dulcis]